MKKMSKKILAFLLAAVMVFGAAPFSGFVDLELPWVGELFATEANAIEASDLSEDFDLTLYNVSVLFDSDYGKGTYFKTFKNNVRDYSIAKPFYNEFEQNTAFMLSVEAWEAIRLVSNPSNIAEYLKYQQQYEEVIFAVLFSALKNEKFEEFSYSNGISKITSLTNKIITSGKNAELLDKTSLDGTERKELIDTAFAFLTEGKDVDSKWSAFGDSLKIVNKFLKFTENVSSAINVINSVSMYVSMLDAGAEVVSYLEALKSKSPNSAFGAAVKSVIDTISHEWLGVVEETIVDSGFVFGIPATKKLIDYAWTGCCAMCPFLAGMTIGEGIGVLATNILFASEDTIEQYEYLKILTQLETASNALLEQYGNSCSASVNGKNSAELMFSVDFSYALYCMGAEASIEMANIAYNKGLINAIINLFSKDSKIKIEQYEESVGCFLNSRKDEYNNVKCYWKCCIEEDYPEFFAVLEEENITPKHIEEVNIEKNEAVFRVGDAMYFKWTLSPIDYEGEIGLKSDNEAVLRSSEPMGILPLALEENIGTANVTIYSIDNPEIFDTIKVTVIGENDEGTTEAEQNIASGTCGSNLIWTLNKNTGRLIISGKGDMFDYGNISAPWQEYTYHLKKVVVESGVTRIGTKSFYDCYNLESVTIGHGVREIGYCAFYNCLCLRSIFIPNSIIGIQRLAFYGTAYYDEPENWEDDVLYINNHLIEAKKSLRNTYIIKEGTKTIGPSAFANCNDLNNVILPSSLVTIGQNAFKSCYGLNNMIIPDSVIYIEDGAFYSCSIRKIKVGNSVQYIGVQAFAFTPLKEIKFGDSLLSVGDYAFESSLLEAIVFEEGLNNIGEGVFYGCNELEYVHLPNSVEKIGKEILNGTTAFVCSNTKDGIVEKYAEQNEYVFVGCQNLHHNSHKHDYISSITSSATCTKAGVLTYTCDCGDNYTESIPVTDHTAGSWQTILTPTTETTGKKIKKCVVCGETVAEETIAKLSKEPIKDNSVIKSPSTSSVSYGDSIILHVDPSKIPVGGYVEWTASNNNFSWFADGTTCAISPSSKGDTTFTATVYDAQGNEVSTDEQTMTSKAGFFDKLIAFFKKLFGLTKTIPQAFKRIF